MIVAINAKPKSIPVPLLMRITAIMFFLLILSITTSYQMALAQRKQTSSSGNVTAQIEPQGTSLQPTNNSNTTTATNTAVAKSGNVTAQIEPQGTSLRASNVTTASGSSSPSSTSGNVTALVKPQGTSLQNTNRSIVGGGAGHR